jgi:hypothetical protein
MEEPASCDEKPVLQNGYLPKNIPERTLLTNRSNLSRLFQNALKSVDPNLRIANRV